MNDEQQQLIDVESDLNTVGIKKTWMPENEDDVDFLIGKLADIRAKRLRIKTNYERMMDETERDAQRIINRYGNPIRWICEKILDKIKWKRKNVKFLNGVVHFTTYAPSFACFGIENEQKARIYAMQYYPPSQDNPGEYFEWVPPTEGYWKFKAQKFVKDHVELRTEQERDDDGVLTDKLVPVVKETGEVCHFVIVNEGKTTFRIDEYSVPQSFNEIDPETVEYGEKDEYSRQVHTVEGQDSSEQVS